MRPPEFTGGNLGADIDETNRIVSGFNEAAGIHRRKLVVGAPGHLFWNVASMRPPEFTGGNLVNRGGIVAGRHRASMRPPEFTGGNIRNVLYAFTEYRLQ